MIITHTIPGIVYTHKTLFMFNFWQGLVVPLHDWCHYLTQMAVCYTLLRRTKQNLASCIYKLTLLIALHILPPECYDCLLSQYLHVRKYNSNYVWMCGFLSLPICIMFKNLNEIHLGTKKD